MEKQKRRSLCIFLLIAGLVLSALYAPNTIMRVIKRNAIVNAETVYSSATVKEVTTDKDGYWIAADEFDYKLFVFYKVVKNETAVKNLKAGDTVYYDITKEELEVLAAKSDKNSDETGEKNKSGNGDESSSGSGSSSSGYGPYAIIRSLKVGETEIFSVKNFNDFIKDNYRLSVIGGSVVSVIAIVTTLVSLVFVIIFTVKGKYAPKTFVYTEDSSDSSSDNSDGAAE